MGTKLLLGGRSPGTLRFAVVSLVVLLLGAIAAAGARLNDENLAEPEAEFQIARLEYATSGCAGSRGLCQPWWGIDYPLSDEHFADAVQRLTKIDTTPDSRHFSATDPAFFHYPFLWMQQPGQGYWNPTDEEVKKLREYFDRGGFMIVDDFHGQREWDIFENSITRVFPDRPIVDIPDNDAFMHLFFNLDRSLPAPGHRHLVRNADGETVAQMAGPPTWRGIYDDKGRLMVVALWNLDMGDAWEHADDPSYPAPMTLNAYRLGINLVLYSMTH